MAITVIIHLYVKPESIDEVIQMQRDLLPDTRSFDGCLSVDVYQDQSDAGHIVLVERWRERADQERYIAWRTERGELEALGPHVSAPPGFGHYDELVDV